MTLIGSSNISSTGAMVDRQLAGDHSDALQARLHELYEPVANDLLEVERILRREMVSQDAKVNELLQQGIRLSGKRLRPALLLLTARACGEVDDDHHLLAAVLEMIHTATLVHDDVLDEATVRRHHETINVRAGNEASVLLGDFLFSHSFYLASTLDSTFACQRIGRATNIVCAGEMRQINCRGDYDVTEQQYLEIIEAKTAELCACCCELGAYYAGADERVQIAMRRFGSNLGIAFQIVDDLLDIVGDQHRTGKSLGTDYRQEKLTLPLIRLLDQADEAERERICSLTYRPLEERTAAMRAALEQSDALQYSLDRADSFATTAAENLAHLSASQSRLALEKLARFVVARSA